MEAGHPRPGHQPTSESEDSSQSPAKERRGPGNNGHSSGHAHLVSGHAHLVPGRSKTLSTELVGDSGISTMTDTPSRTHGLGHREATSLSLSKRPTYEMKERSMTSLSLQVISPCYGPRSQL